MIYTLKLTADEVNVIANALAQLPFIQVAGLLENLKSQVQALETEANAAKAGGAAAASADIQREFEDAA